MLEHAGYVGYDRNLNTVIVAHQGTNPSEMHVKIDPAYFMFSYNFSRESLVTDGDFFLKNLDSALFPGISSSIEVHSGFADEQAMYDLHLVLIILR